MRQILVYEQITVPKQVPILPKVARPWISRVNLLAASAVTAQITMLHQTNVMSQRDESVAYLRARAYQYPPIQLARMKGVYPYVRPVVLEAMGKLFEMQRLESEVFMRLLMRITYEFEFPECVFVIAKYLEAWIEGYLLDQYGLETVQEKLNELLKYLRRRRLAEVEFDALTNYLRRKYLLMFAPTRLQLPKHMMRLSPLTMTLLEHTKGTVYFVAALLRSMMRATYFMQAVGQVMPQTLATAERCPWKKIPQIVRGDRVDDLTPDMEVKPERPQKWRVIYVGKLFWAMAIRRYVRIILGASTGYKRAGYGGAGGYPYWYLKVVKETKTTHRSTETWFHSWVRHRATRGKASPWMTDDFNNWLDALG